MTNKTNSNPLQAIFGMIGLLALLMLLVSDHGVGYIKNLLWSHKAYVIVAYSPDYQHSQVYTAKDYDQFNGHITFTDCASDDKVTAPMPFTVSTITDQSTVAIESCFPKPAQVHAQPVIDPQAAAQAAQIKLDADQKKAYIQRQQVISSLSKEGQKFYEDCTAGKFGAYGNESICYDKAVRDYQAGGAK
jgi:hypothetical protein